MAGVRKQPTKGGLYQAWFLDYRGKRTFLTSAKKKEALQIAQRLEDEHRQVRLGYRPLPSTADKQRTRPFAEAVTEYMGWGETQGGRGGRPWAPWHAHKRRKHLDWWQKRLGLETLGDLDSILPRVEKELRSMLSEAKAPKTVANYVEALAAFCQWCLQRGFLSEDPLKALAPYDTTPLTRRRAMTPEEITRLLASCAPNRRLLLETAFCTGLRANELRSLTVDDLDLAHGVLHLRAEWTKNRKAGVQPVPAALAQRLKSSAESGEPASLYEKYRRSDSKRATLLNPLLYVPSSLSNNLDRDLKTAGIAKKAPGGKLDFHAIRLAYINLVLDSEVSPKEAQALARHSTPDLTFNVYGRTRTHRLSEAVEGIAEAILPKECVPGVYRLAVGAEPENVTPLESQSYVSEELVELRGIEPLTALIQDPAVLWHICANCKQISALRASVEEGEKQFHACSKQSEGTSSHLNRALCVHMFRAGGNEDLAEVTERWSQLSAQARTQIMQVVTGEST